MGPKSVAAVFQQFQASRSQFAQAIAELAGRPDCVEQLMQQNALGLLLGLLGDSTPAIQQNAASAIGRLANVSPAVAEMIVKHEVFMKLMTVELQTPNRYLKRSVLSSLKAIVKHNGDLAKSVVDAGGLEFVVASLEEFDTGVKESAAFTLGFIARHNAALAMQVIGAEAVPLLVLALQEPDVNVRIVAASALSDISKHSPETAQTVVDAGAIPHLVRATGNPDARLRRSALFSLASIAKHSLDMAETVIEADIFPLVLEHAGHPDELVRKAATSLIKEIVKHSPDLAQLVVEGGGLGVLVNSIVRNKGDNRLPAILALGFVAGHTPALSFSVIYSKGVEALALALDEEVGGPVGAAAAWSLGHIARHSTEHSKHVTSVGLLPKILQVYMVKGASEDMRLKGKQALKMILLRTDDLDAVSSLMSKAPPEIFKYLVAQYSKILPKDPAARRAFVTSGGLRKIQELLTPDCAPILRDHILLINSCYPTDIVNYFSPDYPQTLLDRIDQYNPALNIDPSLWTEKLFSDTNIPADIKEEIAALQKSMNQPPQPQPSRKTLPSYGARKSQADQTRKSMNPAADPLRKSIHPADPARKSQNPGGDAGRKSMHPADHGGE